VVKQRIVFSLAACVIVTVAVGCATASKPKVDYLGSRSATVTENDEKQSSIFSNCPPGMVLVHTGPMLYGPPDEKNAVHATKEEAQRVNVKSFCIDKFEWPNQPGEAPTRLVSWLEASTLCSSKGKRLCTEYEFEKACRGPSGTHYTYGDGFATKACSAATDDYGLGQFTNCISGFGVYDMSGGVYEWTSSTPPTTTGPDTSGLRIVRGGMSAGDEEKTSKCTYRLRFATTVTGREIGFRCCGALVKEEVK
jgi:formylglycine-generating enzyme required for sulfatase activity